MIHLLAKTTHTFALLGAWLYLGSYRELKGYKSMTVGTMFTPEQLSERLQVSTKTLANWRNRKEGPPYRKIRGVVRYFSDEIEQYFSECPKGGSDV